MLTEISNFMGNQLVPFLGLVSLVLAMLVLILLATKILVFVVNEFADGFKSDHDRETK